LDEIKIISEVKPVIPLIKLYRFSTDEYGECNGDVCDYCHYMRLSYTYCLIFNELKRAGLLPKEEKKICCFCYDKKIKGEKT